MALLTAADPAAEFDVRHARLLADHGKKRAAYNEARDKLAEATVAELLGEPAGNVTKLRTNVGRLERELADSESIVERSGTVRARFRKGSDAQTFDAIAAKRIEPRREWRKAAERQRERIAELIRENLRIEALEYEDGCLADMQRALSERSALGRRPVQPVAGGIIASMSPEGGFRQLTDAIEASSKE